jgi:lipoprotein-releasing system permease protein
MYKLLLCWRYLLTRYLALACIISVMLGVATLIVVNSVMSGFSTKLRDRLHGLLSDVIIEANGMEGFPEAEAKMARIRKDPYLGHEIVAMSPVVEVFAMMQFRLPNGDMHTRPVQLVGVDPESRSAVGGFREFLVKQKDQLKPSFDVSGEALERHKERMRLLIPPAPVQHDPKEPPPPVPVKTEMKVPRGVVVGNLIATFRHKDETGTNGFKEIQLIKPGDQVILITVSGQRLAPVYDSFIVVDYFKSEMSEYDSKYVFVPLDHLQHLRTMEGRVSCIQIRLRDYREAKKVVRALNQLFPTDGTFQIGTWEDKQSPLLQAIDIEKGILNVLLFLIIAVAGFGILAIFSMIVAEKKRDIGILKALGASNWGVMKIFLGYGLLLGLVGTGLGTLLGLLLTWNINEVEQFVSQITGQDVFNRQIYYFTEIPTHIDVMGVVLVNLGAVAISVIFSVLPALRAALLHPVRALRYE